MQIAEQLKTNGVAVFPCWVRYDQTKNRWDKGPAVPRGVSWQDVATWPYDHPQLEWSSGVVGVPIPAGVLVLDLDSYKGVTREAVEAFLGCALPWDAALIQRTIGGGEHYAFQCSWDARQGDSIGMAGLDTRVAGKGFICTGQGYTPQGFGIFAFAHPHALPVIPDAARQHLERVAPQQPATPIQPTDVTVDVPQIIEALRYIDPGCSRSLWLRICLALKAIFREDDALGYSICEAWSSGEYWHDGEPVNYVVDGKGSVMDQWPTFKAEGDTNPATLFYWAIQGGWQPPAAFDTSLAFGAQAAPVESFNALVARIRQDGHDITATGDIIDEVRGAGCNALQVSLLAAELKSELKQAGVKDKAVTAHIDALLSVGPAAEQATMEGRYGKSDSANALLFLSKFYPNETLVRCDGELYRYTGQIWEKIDEELVKHQVAVDMTGENAQNSRIEPCTKLVLRLTPIHNGQVNREPPNVLIFNNGILDLHTGQLGPHNQHLFSTNLLPYNWNPQAACPQWAAFLSDIFDGDQERIALLQEWFGYMLTKDYTHQKMMFLLGPKRSGKGTIGRILQQLVGTQNFTGGSLSSFATDSFLATLRTKTVVFIGDAEKRVANSRVNQVIERLKTISGNDEVAFDRKFLTGLSETLPTRITMASNSVPNLFDDSGALASRLLVLPFHKSYFDKEDLYLGDRLSAEVEGVAVWAAQGWARLKQNGRFTRPAASEEEAQLIQEAYSPLLRFVSECCDIDDGLKCSSEDIYGAYRAWATSQQEDVVRPKTLTSSLRDVLRGQGVRYGSQRLPGGFKRGFSGIALKDSVPATAAAFQPTVVK